MVSDEIGWRVAVPSVGEDVQCNLRVIANLADRKRVYEARAVPPAKIIGIKHRMSIRPWTSTAPWPGAW